MAKLFAQLGLHLAEPVTADERTQAETTLGQETQAYLARLANELVPVTVRAAPSEPRQIPVRTRVRYNLD